MVWPNSSNKQKKRRADTLRQEQDKLKKHLDIDSDGLEELILVGSLNTERHHSGRTYNYGSPSSIRISSTSASNFGSTPKETITVWDSDEEDSPVPKKKQRTSKNSTSEPIEISDEDSVVEIYDNEGPVVEIPDDEELDGEINHVRSDSIERERIIREAEARLRRREEELRRTRESEERQRAEQEKEDEEDYQNFMDVNDPDLWKQLSPAELTIEDLFSNFQVTSIGPPRKARLSHSQHSMSSTMQLRTIGSGKPHILDLTLEMWRKLGKRSPRQRFERTQTLRKPESILNEIRSGTVASFKVSAGPINKIIQLKSFTVVGSSVTGGQIDQPDEVENPHNKSGSLVIWENLDPHVSTGHSRRAQFLKHYTINDVAICPKFDGGHVVVSSGNDCKVKLWGGPRYSESVHTLPYVSSQGLPPMDIAVKPEGGLFALASRKVLICVNEGDGWRTHSMQLGLNNDGNRVGPLNWGRESTRDILFASSEWYRDNAGPGSHKAFDIQTRRELFQFQLDEEGDALALAPHGERLAIFTVRQDDNATVETAENVLRLYDVRRRDGRDPIDEIILEPSEVNCASFSPDGIYLAIGRADGRTLIYDSRFLRNGVLCDYRHDGPSLVSPGNGTYGIVHLEWRSLPNNQLGLLTGGPDGCVRLWQPDYARCIAKQGKIIAQAHADVSYFSVGDRLAGEHELVVGDGDGGIYFFAGIGNL